MPVANEGLGGLAWDPRTLRYKNPGGDWNPGQGGQPNIFATYFFRSKKKTGVLMTVLLFD